MRPSYSLRSNRAIKNPFVCSSGPARTSFCATFSGQPPPALAVQASIAANTYVVSGHAESKKLQDLLPGIINQLGPDNLANLKKLAETYQSGGAPPPTAGADDDEDVPDLVDNFEEASK